MSTSTAPMVFLSDKIPRFCSDVTDLIKDVVNTHASHLRVKTFIAENGNKVTKFALPKQSRSLLVTEYDNGGIRITIKKRVGDTSKTMCSYSLNREDPDLPQKVRDFGESFVSLAFKEPVL